MAGGGGFTEGVQTCPDCGGSARNVADPINPDHYRQGTLEVIDAIEGLALGYREGNCLKYLARYKYKNGVEDLRKAAWYLDRLSKEHEQGQGA